MGKNQSPRNSRRLSAVCSPDVFAPGWDDSKLSAIRSALTSKLTAFHLDEAKAKALLTGILNHSTENQ
jgi:hypothetical protein